MQEFSIQSSGGGTLHCCKWTMPGKPRGVVQIVHGIAEYASRYDSIASFLSSKGFVVVGEDHMGHGGSISDLSPKGCFRGGWMAAVKDVYALFEKTKSEYSDIPYFLYGHSMGSFLARTFLYTYPDAGLAGALISGTGWQPQMVLSLGIAVCNSEAKKHGDDSTSETVNKLMFGSYNKAYEHPRTQFDWLSRDNSQVDAYIADPLCGFDASVGLARDMLSGMRQNEKKENLNKMPKDIPVYFFAGTMDPVGAMGKGVRKSVNAFMKSGMKNVVLKLYPEGRHEMHNEINKDDVYSDILTFLNKFSD